MWWARVGQGWESRPEPLKSADVSWRLCFMILCPSLLAAGDRCAQSHSKHVKVRAAGPREGAGQSRAETPGSNAPGAFEMKLKRRPGL